jgi:hypothetical protein
MPLSQNTSLKKSFWLEAQRDEAYQEYIDEVHEILESRGSTVIDIFTPLKLYHLPTVMLSATVRRSVLVASAREYRRGRSPPQPRGARICPRKWLRYRDGFVNEELATVRLVGPRDELAVA